MAVYNVTNLTNANDLLEYTQVINDFSGGVFGLMLYVTILIIVYGSIRMSNVQADSVKILAATLWFGAVLSVLFLRMEFVGTTHASASFIMSMGFTMFLYLRGKQR